MLYIIDAQRVSDEEAENITGRKIEPYPGDAFYEYRLLYKEKSIYEDSFFQRLVKEIDNSEFLAPNVIYSKTFDQTYPIKEVCGGTKALFMISRDKEAKYLHESQWFGENCFQILFDLSKTQDIYILDNTGMAFFNEGDKVVGVFTDYLTNSVVILTGKGEWCDYMLEANADGIL